MISLESLARLVAEHGAKFSIPVPPLAIGDREFATDDRPVLMGAVNLSRDSTYRDSIATSLEVAVRKARVMSAQGADVVDIGAESSTARAVRVGPGEQIAALEPVVTALVGEGITVSVETYEPAVAKTCLKAGARVLNLTGAAADDEMFGLAAEFEATVVLCFVGGANVREFAAVELERDPIPLLEDHFAKRIARAGASGLDRIVIDPGLGFYYANLVDPADRVAYQSRILLNAFRLRTLGHPICQALPHAFDLFGDQFRSAEPFFAVLATLGGAGMLRTHEVPQVAAVLGALNVL